MIVFMGFLNLRATTVAEIILVDLLHLLIDLTPLQLLLFHIFLYERRSIFLCAHNIRSLNKER